MSELNIAEGLEYFKGKENAFIAYVEAGTSATRAYEVGDYFWKGGKLYEATAPIASGAAFTVGTNCKLAVIGDDVGHLKESITQLNSNMPTTGDEQLLDASNATVIRARVTTQGQLVSDTGNYYSVIVPHNVSNGEKYFAKYMKSSATFGTIRLYSFNSTEIGSYAVDTPDSYGANGARLPITTSASYLIFYFSLASGTIENAVAGFVLSKGTDFPTEYVPYYESVEDAIDDGIVDSRKTVECVEVGTSSLYPYSNINTAVIANPNSVVKVNCGTYETEVADRSTNKKLIGIDPYLCILNGTDRNYDNPPIEIAGGIISNFTVNMINDTSAEHLGYCVHSDNANCANNTLVIENCIFNCTGNQHAIGFGIYNGETVIFKNCIIVSDTNETESDCAAFYAHNTGDLSAKGKISFHNCIFISDTGYALKLQYYRGNCLLEFEFINCTCISNTLGTGNECVWTDYVEGGVHDESNLHNFDSIRMKLAPTSHGNNTPMLNYSA